MDHLPVGKQAVLIQHLPNQPVKTGMKSVTGWCPESCTIEQKSYSDAWAKKWSNQGAENHTTASPSQVSRSLAVGWGETQGIGMGWGVKPEDGGQQLCSILPGWAMRSQGVG